MFLFYKYEKIYLSYAYLGYTGVSTISAINTGCVLELLMVQTENIGS
jgi:hypothetical protein